MDLSSCSMGLIEGWLATMHTISEMVLCIKTRKCLGLLTIVMQTANSFHVPIPELHGVQTSLLPTYDIA